MQIEKLNEDKIRITLNLDDLKENDIDLHSFMSNSIESQDLFYDMLEKAEKEIGFKTKDYKLMIEAIAVPEGKFVLTVTRFLPEKEQQKKKVKVKRKSSIPEDNLSIYKFNTFEDYLDFCNYLKKHIGNSTYINLKKSTLYKYNSKYFLCIFFENITLDNFKNIHCSIIEFATHISSSGLYERKLIEYGNIIFKNNAIQNCIEAFL